MNNTYRKFFKVLRAWWLTLMLFAFVPMTFAQTITNIGVAPANQLPGEDVTVTVTVADFVNADDYNYYVVYNYADYDMLLEFDHDPDPANGDVNTAGLVAGAGDITITATVPVELYRYGAGELTVLVVDANGNLVYQLEEPDPFVSGYPAAGFHNYGDFGFAAYDNEVREYVSPMFYEFDATTWFSFTLYRINPEPAIKNDIVVKYKVGTGAWTTIRTLDLNDAGSGLYVEIDNLEADWPAGIEDQDITIQIIQTDGDDLSSGIDTWRIENVEFNNVLGEPAPATNLTQVWGTFWVEDLITLYEAGVDNLTIDAPSFAITNFNIDAVDLYPGVQVKYEITSGANVEFPAATIFEVYLTQDFGFGTEQEVLLGTFPLTGASGLPLATNAGEFTFNLPFLPGTDWYLNVRADLRDGAVVAQSGSFEILGVDLTATLDIDATPAADKFELDGVTYLFPGSEIHFDYNLTAGQTINTTNLDVQVVLEYNENLGDGWVLLKSQAYTNTPASQNITADLPEDITASNLDFRLRLVYGTKVDLGTAVIDRFWENYGDGGNVDWLPFQFGLGTCNAGDKLGLHVFASNNTAQTMVVEYKYDGQPVWTQLGTINTLAADNKFVYHFANAAANFDLVPTGELEIENAVARIRWADGIPLGENRAIVRGLRYQVPYVLNVQSNEPSVGILYPHLTLSDDVAILYEYPDTLSNVAVTINYEMQYIPTTTRVAAVLVENGDDPTTDPYLYLGSAAALLNDFGTQTFNIPYTTIQEFIGGHLPNLPAAGDFFDVYLYLTSGDPIMFKTEEIIVDWKENYDAQPMMITDFIDLTGLNTPIYLTYDWIETITPDPLNDYTTPVMEFSLDSGTTWTEFDTYPFTTEIELTGDILTSKTQFRWRQPISMGEWDVQNVKIKSGEDNLVNYIYYKTGIPQTIAMVLPEVETPPVVDPCEDFNNASLLGYEFIPSDTTVNVGEDIEFEWNFINSSSKAIEDSSLVAEKIYVHGVNDMGFTLKFESDKKITQFTMTFPTGVTPTAADVINVDGNTLNPVITAATRLITWTSAAGVVMGTQEIDFNVEFTVATTVNDTIDVAWTLTDADGAVNGTCEIYPAIEFPEGTEFYFYIPDPNFKKSSKELTDVDVEPLTPEYMPGYTQTLYFNLYANSPDWEYVALLDLTFPAGFNIISASDIEYGGDYIAPNISGQTITWGDNLYAEYLDPDGGIVCNFSVQVYVDPSTVGDLTFDWYVEGDIWGAAPHSASGDFVIVQGDFPAILINKDGAPFTIDSENFYFNIPAGVPTGAYNVYAKAILPYEDGKGECRTLLNLRFEDLFVMNDQTPEVYEVELTEVNYLDPSDDYYWAENVEVKFNTFGPWQDFEDLRYEAILTQYVPVDVENIIEENFETSTFPPTGWTVIENNSFENWEWDGVDNVATIAYDNNELQDEWLISPSFDLSSAFGDIILNFDFSTSYYWLVDPNDNADLNVLISTDGGGSWTELWSEQGYGVFTSWTWYSISLSLNAYFGEPDVKIAFQYEGFDAAQASIDNFSVASTVFGMSDHYNLGNIPHVEGTNMYEETFALPSFEEIAAMNFDSDIDGTDFVVEIRAFQGTEDEYFIPSILVESIDEFFLLGGTDETTTPLTFDIEDVLRYAITNKLPIDGYEGQEVYLQFTYSANITAPNFLTLPRLQVTMDNGVTYTDIAIPGSTFESQKRLDATAAGLVYRYKIADEYLTNDTRFRWYQEVPDGVWSIDEISITRYTNEVPLANYRINDPYHIVVKEPAAPASPCDAFSPATLAAYDWAVDSIDTNTGFEAPVIAGEEFEYNFSWNEVLGIDLGLEQYPDSTEFLFYAKKKDSNFKKSSVVDELMQPAKVGRKITAEKAPESNIDLVNAKADPTEEDGLWIQWHTGTVNSAVGYGGGVFTTAARWMPEHLADFDGLELTHVEIAQWDLVNRATLKVWQGPDIDNLVEIVSQDFMQYELSWILIELETPVVIDANQQLWIGVEWDHDDGTFPMAFEEINTLGYGDLIHGEGEDWFAVGDYYDWTWSISGFVWGAEGPILLNKDELPIRLGDEPFMGFVPEDAVTGVYEVEARAVVYGEDGEKWSCGPYAGIVKNDLLIINDNNIPDDVLGIELHGVYTPDTLLFIDTLVVGQEFNAMYSTYGGDWPEGMNFAAVLYDDYRNDVLGVVDLTGEDVAMEGLRMPYLPFSDPTKFEDYDLELRIVAYEGDELIPGGVSIEFEMDEDLGFVTEDIVPVANGSIYGYDGEFNLEGDRWVTTPVMDLSVVDNTKAKIWFTYINESVSQTTQTIPVFQVSIDGGETWITLQLLLSDVDKLYSVGIEDYFSATTQFRWMQPSNMGDDEDVWDIEDVEITTGTTSIFTWSNAIDIVQIVPEVDVDYAFELELEAFDLEPTIYAGNEFDFTYDLVDGGYMFPEGTVFTIYLYDGGDVVIDDLTGEEVVLYEGTEVGMITATAPMTERGAYDVYVVATYTDEEGNMYIYDEDYVGGINIYNPVIRTNYVGLDIPYAGGLADFEGVLEIDVDEPVNPDFYYNLIIEDGGDEWLIAAQQGSANFVDVMIPPFVFGDVDFKIQASTNGPLGEVGTIIDASFDTMLDGGPSGLADESDPGQREWIAYEMEDYDVDLGDYVTLSFDVYFSEDMANLTEAQHMILEYSIDGGRSYTAIHTYPDERFADEMYFDGDWFMEEDLPIPEEAKVEGAIIRFRIQETKGDVSLRNVKISADRTIQRAPYYALVSEIPVARQRVEITAFDALTYCSTSDIVLDYNIRGSFGEFVTLRLYADGEDTDIVIAGVTQGMEQVTVPASVLADLNVSGDITFQFYVEDYTFDTPMYGNFENDFWGDESDYVEVIAPINEFTDVWAMNDYSCTVADRFVLVDPQPYFVYQARNAVTLENLSEAIVFDPEDMSLLNLDGDFFLEIGAVEERIIVEVVVIAQSKDGSVVCETMVIDEQIVFDVRNLALQYKWNNNEIGGVWMDMPETPGDFILCYDSGDLQFRLWDYSADNGDGAVVSADVKWYRDNTETPVGSAGTLANFPLTGNYFAIVTSEMCDVFTTQEVAVTVELAPEKPIIEFIGEQELCEGEFATLQIADNYAHYRWYRNGTMIEGSDMYTIDIYQGGDYEVEVSNYPFDPFVPVCTEWSDVLEVNLNIHDKPEIPPFFVVDNSLCEASPAQIVVDGYEDDVWYQAYIWETGEVTGEPKLGYENYPIILETDVLENEVTLGIIAYRNGVDCDPVYSTYNQNIAVMIYNLTIEVSGNVLSASIMPYNYYENPFGAIAYQWYRNNVAIQNNGNGQSITIYDEAEYSVKVTTREEDGGISCILMASTAKDDEEPTVDVPSTLAVSLYPNPVQTGELKVTLAGEYIGQMQVRVINLAGVVLFDSIIEKNDDTVVQPINVESLTQGVYILQITGGEYSEVQRFIKK